MYRQTGMVDYDELKMLREIYSKIINNVVAVGVVINDIQPFSNYKTITIQHTKYTNPIKELVKDYPVKVEKNSHNYIVIKTDYSKISKEQRYKYLASEEKRIQEIIDEKVALINSIKKEKDKLEPKVLHLLIAEKLSEEV